MKKIYKCIVLLSILANQNFKVYAFEEYIDTMKKDLLTMFMAYPNHVVGVEKTNEDQVFIILKSGNKILYDDKKQKSHEAMLSNPDIQDMLEQIYPLGSISKLQDVNFDPGRARVYSLLYNVYGNSKGKIEAQLGNTSGGQFNKENKAAESLNNALKDINIASRSNPKVGGFVYPINGTYNYRYISGTNRLSPHAFGIAVDVKSHPHDYWKWNTRVNGEKRLLSYPIELVEIFERNNFVWGGKWGHFDILHFEYRPEIIIKARYFSDKSKEGEQWYSNTPEDENIKRYINIIEESLK